MAMVVQHNMNSINANNKLGINVRGLQKASEKLSSGYQINRAADNAAGLAISEKMRSQIKGLHQATANANDGISLIQTAEGGLNETHAILQRMRELAVQSANGTYQDETDREAMQLEVSALKSEITRISKATEYNGIKLLDGSLGGSSNTTSEYGANYGVRAFEPGVGMYNITSNIEGLKIDFTLDASGKGGENAVYATNGMSITVNLVEGTYYSDDKINDLIKNAIQPKDMGAPTPAISWSSDAGGFIADVTAISGMSSQTTAAGLRADSGDISIASLVGGSSNLGSSDMIRFISNSYGTTDSLSNTPLNINILTDVAAGKENVVIKTQYIAGSQSADIELHLATGVTYTEQDIHNILAKEGFDLEVRLTDSANPDGNKNGQVTFTVKDGVSGVPLTMTEGAGVGKEHVSSGKGLTFQIGANGVEDQRVTLSVKDMGAGALGLSNISVGTRDLANAAIDIIDKAVNAVSLQRADLGALQNRLEYTVNNLTTTEENLTAAESQIRDTDMASTMIEYSKFNILQQAAQAMLAQANQLPQGILQLIGG